MGLEIDIVHREKLAAFAKDISKLVKAGDVLALVGDIGVGKTTFTQSLFRHLGVDAKVSSPTFNIVLLYNNPDFKLYHADLYRIDSEEELDHIGFDEIISDDAVVVVEWADKMEAYLKDYARTYLELRFSASFEKRTCCFEGELERRYKALKGGGTW